MVAPITSATAPEIDLGAPGVSRPAAFCARCGAPKSSVSSPCLSCGGETPPPGGAAWIPPTTAGSSGRPLATFGQRFLAHFLENLVAGAALYVLGFILILIGASAGSGGGAAFILLGIVVLLCGGIVPIIVFTIQVGKTGQSWGMRRIGIRCVSEATGQPIGVGPAFVRYFFHIVDAITFYVGYLRPLWDPKHQTFADTFAHTIVVVDGDR